jgi:ribosome-associated protein
MVALMSDFCSALVAELEREGAEDIVVLDLNERHSIFSHVVVASSKVMHHSSALAEKAVKCGRKLGVRARSVEGKETKNWILVDFGAVALHVFTPPARAYYNIEHAWRVRE